MEWLSITADIFGVLGAIFAFFAWIQARLLVKEQQRQNKKITIMLQNGAEHFELPAKIRRAEFARAELLGIIGMIPMKVKGQRYSIEYLGTREFFRQFDDVLAGNGDACFTIPCKEEEFTQFDFSKVGK